LNNKSFGNLFLDMILQLVIMNVELHGQGPPPAGFQVIARACAVKRSACLREAASAKAGRASVGADIPAKRRGFMLLGYEKAQQA
jgi:hypothetical protein